MAVCFTFPHASSSKEAQELLRFSVPFHLLVFSLISALEVIAVLGFLKTVFMYINQSKFSPTPTPGSSGSGCHPHSPETRNKGALSLVSGHLAHAAAQAQKL